MQLSAYVVEIIAHRAVFRAHFGFCPSAGLLNIERGYTLGGLLVWAGFGSLGLLALVVCLGAGGGLTSRCT